MRFVTRYRPLLLSVFSIVSFAVITTSQTIDAFLTHVFLILSGLFFFLSYGAHRDLHSFPTRRSSDLVISESADLLYHWLVLMAALDIDPAEVYAELARREGTSGHIEKASRK